MTTTKKVQAGLNPLKIISIGIMCCCLCLLLTANFFIYPPFQGSFQSSAKMHNKVSDEESPAPVEEKSSSKTGLTIQEEFTHELHALKNPSEIINSTKHNMASVEKLQTVHFELISPPPRS